MQKTSSKKLSPVMLAVLVVLSLLLVVGSVYTFNGNSFVFGSNKTDYTDTQSKTPTEDKPRPEEQVESRPEEPLGSGKVTVQMAGDVLIHSTMYTAASLGNGKYNFSNYVEYFTDVFNGDLNIVNLENPVDVNGGNAKLSNFPRFNAPYEVLDGIKLMGVDLCTTANNHSYDKEFNGLKATLNNLDKAGLEHVGTYATREDSEKLYIKEINGVKVGVLSFASAVNFGGTIKDSESFCIEIVGHGLDAADRMLEYVKRMQNAGAEFIIVGIHWGVEYSDRPTDTQKKIAQALCDGGVDVIMGSHSHCVQPLDLLTSSDGGHKTVVAYSLGNFFVNQKGLDKPKTQYGMLLSVTAERDSSGKMNITDTYYVPTYTYVTGERGQDFLRLIPSGEFAMAKECPELFPGKNSWNTCKKAWEHVVDIAGDVFPAEKNTKRVEENVQ